MRVIDYAMFERLAVESVANDDLESQLEAWSVDQASFGAWLAQAAEAVGERIGTTVGPREGLVLALWMGFEIGYKSAVEVETQRVAGVA